MLGLGLSLYLTLDVHKRPASAGSKGEIKLSYHGEGASEAPLDPYKNLITRVALYVLLSHRVSFPHDADVSIEITNEIPFGRGLGSSAAAVVAGVHLASALGDLKLSQDRMKDYALMVERHPDNITAALVGGFTGSFLRMLDPSELAPSSIPLAEVLPAYPPNAGPPQPGDPLPPQPPRGVGKHVSYPLAPGIGVVVVVPRFEVETAKARGALPDKYERADVVRTVPRRPRFLHDDQRKLTLSPRTGVQPSAPRGLNHLARADATGRERDLGVDARPRTPAVARSSGQWHIHPRGRTRSHQHALLLQIPGLSQIVNHMTPVTHPGLLGICLSGAGPTILALVATGESSDEMSGGSGGVISTDTSEITLGSSSSGSAGPATPRMREIGEAIKAFWKEQGNIDVDWLALKVDQVGATCTEQP